MRLSPRFVLILSSLVAVLADMMFVWWAKEKGHSLTAFATALILLLGSSLSWAFVLRAGVDSATAITFYAVATIIGCSALGAVVFKEPLSPTTAAGLVLGVIALVLVGWGSRA